MKKRRRILSFLLALTLFFGLSGCQESRVPNGGKNKIERYFRSCMDDRGFSGAVYAVYCGETVFDGGAGMATESLKNGSEVAYGVASVTKQFTAAVILQLYEQGRLDLSDPIGKFFPDYRYGKAITVRHLLCQRSGIPDYMVDMDTTGKQVIISVTEGGTAYAVVDVKNTAEENQKIIRDFFLSRELLFEPGAAFDYSDSNYALLAEIVSQVSGLRYHEYVRQHIFEPLGMAHSAFIDDFDRQQLAAVAQTDRDEFAIDYYTVKGAEYGCGDILTTPRDLYRWYRGLMDGKVIGEASYQLMTTNYSAPSELGYGFGQMISDRGDSKAVYHYGYIPSYYSAVIYVPAHDLFLTVLSNHGDGDPHKLASDLAVYFGSVIGVTLVDIE
ncbi:serine hydrolase domain-containing protein [Ruminococcus sp.]|uniref:serine hydrolase domain-containing protein n=1 Tax=Ruminococcus sp. TaxID=41978 RepID=UPI00389020DC